MLNTWTEFSTTLATVKKWKGEFDYPYRGNRYYDKETGALVTGKYFEHKNNWYYANSKGIF